MNKNHLHLASLLLSFCLLSGCDKEKNENEVPEAPVAVSLTAGIGDVTPAPESASKWEAGDAIGLCMIAAGSSATTGSSTTAGSTAAGSATTVNDVFNYRYTAATAGTDVQMLPDGDANTAYFPGDGSTVDFLAYHPYAATGAAEGSDQNEGLRSAEGQGPTDDLRLPVDVGTQPATDLLTARADGYHRLRPAVALRFEHRLVKLIFALAPNDNVDATQLPGARLVIRGMNTKARCLLADGSIADAGAPSDIEVPLNAAGTSGMAIVLPRDAAAGVSFVVTLADGRVYTTILSDAQALTAGTQNTVTLNLDATPMEASINVGPWQEGGGGEGDAGMEIK